VTFGLLNLRTIELSPLGVRSNKRRHVSGADDSQPCQLLHSGRGYWISGIAFIHIVRGRPFGLIQFSKVSK